MAESIRSQVVRENAQKKVKSAQMASCGGWEAVRQAVRQRVGASAFNAWFRSLEGSLVDGTLVVRCPDRFSRDWVRGRYHEVLRSAAPDARGIEYRVVESDRPQAPSARAPRTTTPQPPVQHTFETFAVDAGNALALEAARAVARGDAGRCSPLVLAGASGVGKTHLCRAIGAARGDDVLHRSSEEFTTEVTQGIRADRMPSVRQRYRRSSNVLILEDVQFLNGKRATQVELFHTLDHLLGRGKSVVLTADRTPHEIDGLDGKLVSRMASGLVARIGPPEPDTRRAILRAKAAAGGVRLPDDCLDLLIARPTSSARDLISGLNQVVARATLLKRPITTELVSEALAAVSVPGGRLGPEVVIERVARACSLEVEQLRGRSRKRRFTRPRQLAMYLCRRYTDASLKEIGRAFRRDHTSVLYAIDAVERRATEEPQLRYELEALAARLRG